MTRGFNGPPDPHLLRREPLRADELDRQVIRGMTGFEFGTEDEIERRLVAILESEAYRRAVQYWENKRDRPQVWGESLSNSSLAIEWDSAGGQGGGNKEALTPKKNKRFSGFDFYRRKLFSPSTSPPTSPFASPSPSQSHLSNTSLSDINQKEPPNPTRGYHQLISIYYLAREKMERDRVYGPGHFASSQLSVNPPQPAPEEVPPPSASKQVAVPASTVTPQKASGGTDYNMRPSRLPPPESLHYSKMSYDSPVTPSPTGATFQHQQQQQQQQPRSRARDAGLPGQKHVDMTPPSPITVPNVPDSAAIPAGPASATLPRAPPASTHRRSHSVSHRQGVPRGLAGMFGSGSGGGAPGVNEHGLRVNVNSNVNGHDRPRTAGPELATFSERMEDEQAEAPSDALDAPPEVVLSPAPPLSAGATLVRKFGSLLVGGGSVRGSGGDRASKRTSILGGFGSPRPSVDVDRGSEKEIDRDRRQASSLPNEKVEQPSVSAPTSPSGPEDATPVAEHGAEVEMKVTPTGGISHSQTQPLHHRRAATILDPQGHAKRHERRSSTGGALLSSVGGTIGRHRRPSTAHGNATGRASQFERQVPEEGASGQSHVNGAGAGLELTDGEEDLNANAADKDFKPVFLKGLFRYVPLPTL